MGLPIGSRIADKLTSTITESPRGRVNAQEQELDPESRERKFGYSERAGFHANPSSRSRYSKRSAVIL